MKTALRIVALLAVYSGLAFMGDYAVRLLAGEVDSAGAVAADGPVEEADRVVDVRPGIRAGVRVRDDDRCIYSVDRESTIPSAGVELVDIHAGSGELHVEGDEALEEIVVVRTLCASEEELLDRLEVSTSVSGGVLRVETHYPERDRSRSASITARIDLVVLVPAGLAVDIDDSSGEIEVRGTGDLRIDDSSGGITVGDIDGGLDVDDSSGGLDVVGVRGDVRVDDSSGGLELRSITGTASVRDGSGGIEIADVGVDVFIESDGSGGIEVRDVGRDFVVRRDGSGGIRHSGIQGSVDIPDRKRRER